jgi:hypothetical protein
VIDPPSRMLTHRHSQLTPPRSGRTRPDRSRQRRCSSRRRAVELEQVAVESPLGREIHHRVSGRVLNQHDSRNAWPGSGIETGLRARGRRQRALTGRLPTYGAEH